MLLDKYKVHTTEESKKTINEQCNADVVYITAGCTPFLQPMDIGANMPFKTSLRSSWSQWMDGPHDFTPGGNIRPPRRQDVIDWVSAAWAAVDAESIKRSFLRAGISNALDGSEEELLGPDVPHIPARLADIGIFVINEDAVVEDGVIDVGDMLPFDE